MFEASTIETSPITLASSAGSLFMQHTIAHSVTTRGVGLHSGATVTLRLEPAPANSGITFIHAPSGHSLPALWRHVQPSKLCTRLGDNNIHFDTIEHVMSALWAAEIDNLRVIVDATEMPIFDGSAAPILALLDTAGRQAQGLPRRFVTVTRAVTVADDKRYITLRPSRYFSARLQIAFSHPLIATQACDFNDQAAYRSQIAPARTFGFERDIAQLRQHGLTHGGSLANAVVFSDDAVLNPEGLRGHDEPVRHKMLDLIGDLYLAGGHLLAEVEAVMPSHQLNTSILAALWQQQAGQFTTLAAVSAAA